MTTINDFETAVRSCFAENGIQSLWYGGKEGKIGDDPNKMYIAIREDENWRQNRCVLRDWFFDYKKFDTMPLHIDCERYGVYCIWIKDQSGICAWCVGFRADKAFKSVVEEEPNGTYICEDCSTKTDMSFWDKPTPYNSNRDLRSLCPCCKINKMIVESRTELEGEVVKVCKTCYYKIKATPLPWLKSDQKS